MTEKKMFSKYLNRAKFFARWQIDSRIFRCLVVSWTSSSLADFTPSGVRVGVVVGPWLGTTVPWYTITLALFLAKRGRRITFIIDDVMFGNDSMTHRVVLKSIEHVFRLLRNRFEILRLSEFATPQDEAYISTPSLEGLINRMADQNTVWYMRGESDGLGQEKYRSTVKGQLAVIGKKIETCLYSTEYQYLLVPGGIYGSSGLWYEVAKGNNIRVVTYDSGPGVAMFSTDGVAAQLHDLPRAFESLQKDQGARQWVLSQAQAERQLRQAGKDKFASQMLGSSADAAAYKAGGILMALNSPWDTASLGLHMAFKDTREWIIETVRWVVNHTNETIVIRQHPGERFEGGKSIDDIGKLLFDAFGQHPQIVYIAAETPANSYDLLDRAHTVLIHTSTFGVEAAMMGKVVITSSNAYYSDMGFVHSGFSRERYFELLDRAVRGEFSDESVGREAASYCYYLGQCCNWIVGEFNIDNFSKWAQMDPVSLHQLEDVQLILTAIDENIPVSTLQHKKNFRMGDGLPATITTNHPFESIEATR